MGNCNSCTCVDSSTHIIDTSTIDLRENKMIASLNDVLTSLPRSSHRMRRTKQKNRRPVYNTQSPRFETGSLSSSEFQRRVEKGARAHIILGIDPKAYAAACVNNEEDKLILEVFDNHISI